MDGQIHTPAVLLSGKNPATRYRGGCLCPRTDLNCLGKRKSLVVVRIRPRDRLSIRYTGHLWVT